MKMIINPLQDSLEPLYGQCVLLIGNFDIYHKGHHALFQKALELAAKQKLVPAVLTFDPHPRSFFQEGFKRIYSISFLTQIFKKYGVENVVVQEFNSSFMNLSQYDFEKNYLEKLFAPQAIVVGEDFCYGKEARGSAQTLISAGVCPTYSVPLKLLKEKKISTTWIKQEIKLGKVDFLVSLLGRPYEVQGQVVQGRGIGGKDLVPTANLLLEEGILPGSGVFAVEAEIQNLGRFPAVANVGVAPTVSSCVRTGEGVKTQKQLEVHIIDKSLDIYGESISIHFYEKIREEKEFSSLEELLLQIKLDINFSKNFFLNKT